MKDQKDCRFVHEDMKEEGPITKGVKKLYADARECVNGLEVGQDTSDKLRVLVDKLDILGNTLCDANGFLDGNPQKPPTYETPSSLLHALYLMEIQTEFLLSVAEDIRIKLR